MSPNSPSFDGSQAIVVSPFDDAYLTPEQQGVIDAASDVLVAACMAKAGFTYQPTSSQSSTASAGVVIYDPLWGPLDPEAAAKNGYNNPYATSAGPNGPLVQYAPGSSVTVTPESDADRAYNDALLGVNNTGGCFGEASEQLGMAGTSWMSAWDAVDNARQQADAAALNDSAITGAVQAWSACMLNQGFSYGSPQEAMSDAWPLTPDRNELNTAQADAQCKLQVNLMATISQVTVEYEQKAVTANLPAVQHLQQLGLAAVAQAEKILAQQPK